ncbi:Agamous-like MADS-box protein AGL80, partial [Mucuna pruriens]
MTRKKVNPAYITNDSKRKATLRKRKKGLIKKIDEINILCGIEACAILYTPHNPQPEVCPSDWGVQSVLSKFRGVSELEQSKKKFNQESFLRQRIVKAQGQLKKLKNENRKKEMTLLMFQYFNDGNIFDKANMIDLNDLSHMIDQILEEIGRKNNMSQTQEEIPIVENGGKPMIQGEQEFVTHVQGLVDIINGGGGDEMLTLGDVIESMKHQLATWKGKRLYLGESKDLESMIVDQLMGSLQAYEKGSREDMMSLLSKS